MITAEPFDANQERECIIKAISALDFGAKTPAGEKRGSFISVTSSSPTAYRYLKT